MAPGTVIRWLDQSGNGLQAEVVNAQVSPFTIDPQVLNGHDAVRCTGGWMQIDDDPALQWGNGNFAIGMVVRTDLFLTSPTRFFEKALTFAEGITFRQPTQSTLEFAVGGLNAVTVSIPVADDFHIAIMRGQQLDLQVDASMSTGVTTAIDVDNPGAPLMFCMPGTNAPQAAVAELIAIEGDLSDADAVKLMTYWQDKFGL